MINETLLSNGLIERKSDQNVYIQNTITGGLYEIAIDLPNEERISKGFDPYYYIETDEQIVIEQKESNSFELNGLG